MKEVVENGVTGIVVASGDALALSKAIAKLLADIDLRRRMGDAGYQRLREWFTSETLVDQYDGLVSASNAISWRVSRTHCRGDRISQYRLFVFGLLRARFV